MSKDFSRIFVDALLTDMECGGKRSATPLWPEKCRRRFDMAGKSFRIAALLPAIKITDER